MQTYSKTNRKTKKQANRKGSKQIHKNWQAHRELQGGEEKFKKNFDIGRRHNTWKMSC